MSAISVFCKVQPATKARKWRVAENTVCRIIDVFQQVVLGATLQSAPTHFVLSSFFIVIKAPARTLLLRPTLFFPPLQHTPCNSETADRKQELKLRPPCPTTKKHKTQKPQQTSTSTVSFDNSPGKARFHQVKLAVVYEARSRTSRQRAALMHHKVRRYACSNSPCPPCAAALQDAMLLARLPRPRQSPIVSFTRR